MRPLKLILDGFLSYREKEEIDFTSFDVACITGENGAGKSSILDGITYALFGKARVSSNDSLINLARENAEVVFEFLLNNVQYRIIRKIYKNSKPAEISIHYLDPADDLFVALSGKKKSENDQIIQKLIKMDHETFTTASFLLQGKADSFAVANPAKRKEILSKILRLEAWDAYFETTKERRKQAKNEVGALDNEIIFLNGEIGKESSIRISIEEHTQQLSNLSAEITQAAKNLKNVDQLLTNLESSRAEIESKNIELESKNKQKEAKYDQINGKIENRDAAQALIDRTAEITASQQKLDEARDFLAKQEKLQIKIDGIQSDIQGVESIIKIKDDQLSKSIKELREQETKIVEDQKKLPELREKLGALNSMSGEAADLTLEVSNLTAQKKLADDFTSGYTKFLTMDSSYKDLNRTRDQAIKELEKNQRDANDASQIIQNFESEVAAETKKFGEITAKQKTFVDLTEQLTELKNTIQNLENELVKINLRAAHLDNEHSPNCPTCEKPLSQTEKADLISKLARESSDIRKQIDVADKEQSILMESRQALTGGRQGSDPFNNEINSLNGSIASLKTKIGIHKGTADEWNEEKAAALENLRKPSDDLLRIENEINEVTGILKDRFSQLFPLDNWSDPAASSRVIENHKQKINKRIETLQVKQKELESLPVDIERVNNQISDIENSFKSWDAGGKMDLEKALEIQKYRHHVADELTKISELKAKIDEIGYDPEQIERSSDFITENHARIEKDTSDLKAAPGIMEANENDIALLGKDLEGIGKEIANIQEVIQVKQASLGDEPALITQKTDLSNQIEGLENDRNQFTMDLGKANEKLATIEEQKNSLEEKRANREKTQLKLINLEVLEKAFGKGGVPNLLIEQAIPEVEAEANRILSKLTDGYSVRFPTQKGYKNQKREDLKETLEIEISDGAGSRDYDTYSGGETFRVNFALRLALSKMLAHRADAKLETLVIDEGFGSQDEDGKQKLVEAIKAIQSEFKMILVITHMEELKEKFDRRIEVRKVGRTSRVNVN